MIQDQLKGKRLMLMGGVQAVCDIIDQAHRLGVEVYETDYLENSPAKKIADKSFMVSCIDVDAVVELCKEQNIDGVFTGYTDSLLPYTQEVCSKINLPFWGNSKNIETCIDKDKFKQACKDAGVPVIPGMQVTEHNYENIDVEMPVVIKPVDNSGSRGVFKCYNKEDYKSYCEKALTFSKKKELLVERLMDVNSEFSVYYMLYEGKAYITSMGDRYVDVVNVNTAPQAKGMRFPSIHLDAWMKKMDTRIKHFFDLNDMRDGYVFIQGFCENNEFFINEIGYRLNGGYTYKFVEKFTGFNVVHQLLTYSLTGMMDKELLNRVNPYFNGIGFLVTVALKQGTIGKIEGLSNIRLKKSIYDICQMHFEGDVLNSVGTSSQVFAYIITTADNMEELSSTIEYIRQTLKVTDTEGDNMLVGIVDSNLIK